MCRCVVFMGYELRCLRSVSSRAIERPGGRLGESEYKIGF